MSRFEWVRPPEFEDSPYAGIFLALCRAKIQICGDARLDETEIATLRDSCGMPGGENAAKLLAIMAAKKAHEVEGVPRLADIEPGIAEDSFIVNYTTSDEFLGHDQN